MYSITVGITSLATDFILVKTVLDCFRFGVLHVPVHKTSILNVILLNQLPYEFLHASKKGKEVGAAPSEFNFLYVHLVHIHL